MSNHNSPEDFKLKPLNLLLNVIGMVLVFFAAFEIYSVNEKGAGVLSDLIPWHYYPWVFMLAGIALMVPFHRQIRQAYKIVKQQKKEQNRLNEEQNKRNKPDF